MFTKQTFENPIIVVALVNSNQPLKSHKLNELFLETISIPPLEKEDRFRCLLWLHQREYFDRMTYAIKQAEKQNYIDISVQNLRSSDLEILRKVSNQTQGKL